MITKLIKGFGKRFSTTPPSLWDGVMLSVVSRVILISFCILIVVAIPQLPPDADFVNDSIKTTSLAEHLFNFVQGRFEPNLAQNDSNFQHALDSLPTTDKPAAIINHCIQHGPCVVQTTFQFSTSPTSNQSHLTKHPLWSESTPQNHFCDANGYSQPTIIGPHNHIFPPLTSFPSLNPNNFGLSRLLQYQSHWDGALFSQLTITGYIHEKMTAFYPLLPTVVRSIGQLVVEPVFDSLSFFHHQRHHHTSFLNSHPFSAIHKKSDPGQHQDSTETFDAAIYNSYVSEFMAKQITVTMANSLSTTTTTSAQAPQQRLVAAYTNAFNHINQRTTRNNHQPDDLSLQLTIPNVMCQRDVVAIATLIYVIIGHIIATILFILLTRRVASHISLNILNSPTPSSPTAPSTNQSNPKRTKLTPSFQWLPLFFWIFSPINIFFLTTYTELIFTSLFFLSLYAFSFTFSTEHRDVQLSSTQRVNLVRFNYNPLTLQSFSAWIIWAIAASLAGLARSNGALLLGFPVFIAIVNSVDLIFTAAEAKDAYKSAMAQYELYPTLVLAHSDPSKVDLTTLPQPLPPIPNQSPTKPTFSFVRVVFKMMMQFIVSNAFLLVLGLTCCLGPMLHVTSLESTHLCAYKLQGRVGALDALAATRELKPSMNAELDKLRDFTTALVGYRGSRQTLLSMQFHIDNSSFDGGKGDLAYCDDLSLFMWNQPSHQGFEVILRLVQDALQSPQKVLEFLQSDAFFQIMTSFSLSTHRYQAAGSSDPSPNDPIKQTAPLIETDTIPFMLVSNNIGLYSYVQKVYWNIGSFHYYTPQQIPNFILAAPIFIVLYLFVTKMIITPINDYINQLYTVESTGAISLPKRGLVFLQLIFSSPFAFTPPSQHRSTSIPTPRSLFLGSISPLILPLAVLLVVMGAVAAVVMHIQVTTRFLLTSPLLYWVLAIFHSYHVQPAHRDGQPISSPPLHHETVLDASNNVIWSWPIVWCVCYNILGCILFSIFGPWT